MSCPRHKTLAPEGECHTCDALAAEIEHSVGMKAMGFTEVKDSGARQSFDTGAVRDTQDGKPRIDAVLRWLPMEALMRVARHYQNGADKYDEDNYRKGIPASRCLSSAARHLFQYIKGDRSEDHLSAVVFNILCVILWEVEQRDDLLDTKDIGRLE